LWPDSDLRRCLLSRRSYALHINGVYDHYSWRAYLGSGGDPDQIYKPLDGWKPGGSREQELDFWMQEPVPARKGLVPSGGSAGARTTSKSKGAKGPKTVNKTIKKAAAAKKKATKTEAAKKPTKKPKPKTTKKKAKAKTSKL
jgi:hypothetical protein